MNSFPISPDLVRAFCNIFDFAECTTKLVKLSFIRIWLAGTTLQLVVYPGDILTDDFKLKSRNFLRGLEWNLNWKFMRCKCNLACCLLFSLHKFIPKFIGMCRHNKRENVFSTILKIFFENKKHSTGDFVLVSTSWVGGKL